jgi:hypothetical protein
VATQPATQIVEKGRSGRLAVHEGDHVGVSGFVAGHAIRAIKVRIYPTKAKPYELRGTVAAIARGKIIVSAGGRRQTVAIGSGTTISVGRTPAAASQIHVGDRVRMRVASGNGSVVALSIYVYVSHSPRTRVRLHGTVRNAGGSRLVLAVGSSQVTISVSAQTSIRAGSNAVSARALRPGQTVTVYACCQGQALVATSIHIDISRTARSSFDVRGQVTALGGSRLGVTAGGKTTTIMLAAATVVQIGAASARPGDIRVGDEVTVRAYRSGTTVIAERVHVLASSRTIHTIRGTVVAVTHGTVIILARGKRYTVAIGSSVPLTLNGKRVSLSAVRPGDRIDIQVEGTATPIRPVRGTLTRSAPKMVTINGTVSQVFSGGLVIVDASGGRHVVRLDRGVHPLLHGQVAPASALFPGVRARARGRLSGATLVATSLTITVSSKTIHGRIARASAAYLLVQATSATQVRVDVPSGVSAMDGKKRLAPGTLPAGVYLRAAGWVETTDRLRATSLTIEHPSLSIAATVVATSSPLTVATSAGERYQLRIPSGVQIVASRSGLPLKPADLPIGVRVHVDGTIDDTGRLQVSAMSVHLSSVTLEGQVIQVDVPWLVRSQAGEFTLRLQSDTPISQGSHVLSASDVVPGDAVTVYGYALAQSTVLVRKIDVHRKLEALDGTIAAVNPDGFVLQSADGQHRVITSASTLFSGISTAVVQGLSVHVTGYRRGDGVVLATRVRILKAPKP